MDEATAAHEKAREDLRHAAQVVECAEANCAKAEQAVTVHVRECLREWCAAWVASMQPPSEWYLPFLCRHMGSSLPTSVGYFRLRFDSATVKLAEGMYVVSLSSPAVKVQVEVPEWYARIEDRDERKRALSEYIAEVAALRDEYDRLLRERSAADAAIDANKEACAALAMRAYTQEATCVSK
ncbi:MAG: hypothetical protein EBT64_06745 [Gammaproteobacteria bacterium]|nr:hypothetical protein [Gammaproteobacteria bacterium]